MKKVDKRKTRPMSFRARRALKIMVEKGGSQRKALKEAGFSQSVADNPTKVTKTSAFIEALDKVGLTDEYLAKGFRQFTKAGELKEYTFWHKRTKEIVDLSEDHPKYSKKKGAVNKEEIFVLTPVSTKIIEKTIGRITGADLIDIQDHHDKRVAFYQKPDFTARKTGYELSSKAKGHLAPDTIPPGEMKHSISDDDRKFMQSIFGINEK